MHESRLPAVLLFPGQGSQRLGMLEGVSADEDFRRLLDAAEALTGMELRAIADEASGDPAALADTRVSQPLLYLVDVAWGTLLTGSGVAPVALAGHSLGELAALALAGVYSIEAGLELVVERSRLMAQVASATPGGMSAVLGMEGHLVSTVLQDMPGVWVANDNSPSQTVISGTHAGIESATEALMGAGARRIVPLKVAGPFHSPLMEPARSAFEDLVYRAEFLDARIPVYQNTEPTPALDAGIIRQRLAQQITAPVRWTETMTAIAAQGPVVAIESGPGAVLTGLARGMEGLSAVSVEQAGLERILEEVVA